MVHNLLRQRAFILRKRGKSYSEIIKELNLTSKGTLSYWFKDFKISPKVKKRLRKNILLARDRGLLAFNKNRTKKIIAENEKVLNKSIKGVPLITRKGLLLIGASLYWGEGSFREGKKRYPSVAFSNSDPKMIKVFMSYLRNALELPDLKIKARIQIHPNIRAEKAKKFWSKITKLPKERFRIFKQISRAGKFKRKGNFLPYGTLTIRINDRKLFYKIKGTILGIAERLNEI